MGTAAAQASSSGGPRSGCYTYTSRYRIGCKYVCANGEESTNCGSDATWIYVVNTHCPGSSGPGSGRGGWGGWDWGSGGPGYSGLPGLPPCVRGDGDCFNSPAGQSGGN